MGHISRFDITDLTVRYGLQYFVETGVGQCESLFHVARNHPFVAYYSCDWDEIMVRGSRWRLRDDPRVLIIHARSTNFLQMVLGWMPASMPCFFWLDAHFPGTGHPDEKLRLPLQDELEIIANMRREGRDVIAIDDLRLFDQGPFEEPLQDDLREWAAAEKGIGFVYDTLARTHDIACFYDGGGYVLATPSAKYSAMTDTPREMNADADPERRRTDRASEHPPQECSAHL